MRFRISVLAFSVLLTESIFAQDLSQLTARVSKLWEARSRVSRVEALEFIEPETRDTYLKMNEAPFFSFKISSIEFTDDPNHVDVLVKVRGLIPGIGEMDRTTREAWFWKNGQWMMHAMPPPSMFGSDAKTGPSVTVRPDFQVAQTIIDVGQRAQGETIEGKIPFKAPRSEIRVIRPVERIPGLTIGTPVWTDASAGYLPYRWETALLSQNINQTIPVEAIATSDGRTAVEVQFRARINGKVGFKQVPEVIDPVNSGQVELQIQNLMAKPLKILTALSYNPAYVIDESVPGSIEPGKSGSLLIRYSAQAQATGASIGLVLSEDLSPAGMTTVPLSVKIPEEKRFSYTTETLKPFVPPPPAGFK
jgi:hypothetical protein